MEKTWTYREIELRETIANEIENSLNQGRPVDNDLNALWTGAIQLAANIARGQK